MPYQDTREGFSQQNQRRNVRLTDQWGRQYHANIEIRSGAPCGLIQPLYQTVLPVPMKYIVRGRDELRPYDVLVDVNQWIADARQARLEWEQQGRKIAQRQPNYDPRAKFGPDVLEMIGPPPQAVEPLIALRQGNSWMLGKTKKPDPRLTEFFAPEVINPDYLIQNEPNFRDEEDVYDDVGTAFEVPEYDEMDLADVLETKAEKRARLLRELEELDEIGADPLGTEERADPRAIGGKTVPIKSKSDSPEAIRKRAERERKRKEREEAEAQGRQAARDRELERMEKQEQEAISQVQAGATGARPLIEKTILGEEDQSLLEAVSG